MSLSRIWPLLIVVATPLLAWAFHDRAGWGHTIGVLAIGFLLAVLAVSYRALPFSTFRTAVTGIVVLCVVATFASGIAYGDPLVAVPFLAALAGAAGLSRAPGAPRQPRDGAPASR